MNINQRLASIQTSLEAKQPKRYYRPFEGLETTELRKLVSLTDGAILEGVVLTEQGTTDKPEYDIPLLKQRLAEVQL